MLWKKKPSTELTRDLKRELEAAGVSISNDLLGTGIRLIRSGREEFLPAWVKEFGKSHVFVVSTDETDLHQALIFGPSDDKNYIAVFTNLEAAKDAIHSAKEVLFPVRLKGNELLELANAKGRGICLNSTREEETLALPASMMNVFLQGLEIC